MYKYLTCLCFMLLYTSVCAQSGKGNDGRVLLLNFNYASQLPAGDLSDRFGANLYLGSGLEIITAKKNYIFGIDGGVIFGNNVKEDVIATLRNSDGFIVAGLNGPVNVALRERGLYLGALVGKIFPTSKKNKRAGIRTTMGLGFLQHKVRIQDDSESAPQVNDTYSKGYDRLTNGLALQEFVGYQLLSNNRRINFIIGLEFTQAFTKSRRSYNFDTMSANDDARLDLLFGLRVGWTLPFYIGEKGEDIYY